MKEIGSSKKYIKYGLLILAAVCILGGYWIFYLFPMNGYQETIVSAGQASFTAEFAHVSAVVPCNNDRTLEQLLDEEPVTLSLRILDQDGNVAASLEADGSFIHTNSYISTDQFAASGVPFELVPGERYSIHYVASSGGIPLDALSFSLCGAHTRSIGIIGMAALLCAAAGLVFLSFYITGGHKIRERNQKGTAVMLRMMFLWLAVAFLFLLSAPKTEQSQEERGAFANAYAVSNLLLGKPCTDEEGYVYIEEEGIRNMGNTSYSVPLNRFWTDWEYGNARTPGTASSLFRTAVLTASSQKAELFLRGGAIVLLDGAAIAAARICGMPYQLVYLAGPILNMLIVLLLYWSCLRMILKTESVESGDIDMEGPGRTSCPPLTLLLVAMVFLMPAMMQGVWSYQGIGLRAALGMTFGLMCYLDENPIPHWRMKFLLLSLALFFTAPWYLLMGAGITGIRDIAGNRDIRGNRDITGNRGITDIRGIGDIRGIRVGRERQRVGRFVAAAGAGISVLLSVIVIFQETDLLSEVFADPIREGESVFLSLAAGFYSGAIPIRLDGYCLIAVLMVTWVAGWKKGMPAAPVFLNTEKDEQNGVYSAEKDERSRVYNAEDRQNRVYNAGKDERNRIYAGRMAALLVACDCLIVLSGTFLNAQGGLPAAAGRTWYGGALFLPLSLVPVWTGVRAERRSCPEKGRTGGISDRLVYVCGLYLCLVLFVGLKCIS